MKKRWREPVMSCRTVVLGFAVFAAALTGCAHGVVDEPDDPLSAESTLEVEIWDVDDSMSSNVLTASEFQADPWDSGEPELGVVNEADACEAIIGNYHDHGIELGCATTTHVCPDMLRFAFGQACLQYDGASVNDCVDRIRDADSCESLWASSCNVMPVPQSAPDGCPAETP